MNITPYTDNIELYLSASDTVDYHDSEITKLAEEIANRSKDDLEYIKNAYEYVRDNIAHSADINNDTITCKASEVLKEGHGICLAKSHLLAALLRCKSIPAGFCYQRLILDDDTAPVLILHGLNGVYIQEYHKWIRLDARGNKTGVNAQFSIETEQLAFTVRSEKGEEDIPMVYPEPDRNVLEALTKNKTRSQLWSNLPKELVYSQTNDEIEFEIIKTYPAKPKNKDGSIRWYLYRWDDGKDGYRFLARCKKDNKLYLVQKYKLVKLFQKPDTIYEDWYEVENERIADKINRELTGPEMERTQKPAFSRKYKGELE